MATEVEPVEAIGIEALARTPEELRRVAAGLLDTAARKRQMAVRLSRGADGDEAEARRLVALADVRELIRAMETKGRP